MPRRYNMNARVTAVGETKARIVRAAKELHAQNGLQGTSHTDIADKAGVALATVYRHFPTIADLIPACASSIAVLQPLTSETIAAIFQDQVQPLERLETIIRGTCDCYERDGDWLQAARREGDLIPTLADIVQEQQAGLRTLVRAALDGTGAHEHHVQVVAALMDFPLWRSLQDMGLMPAEATGQVLEFARIYLAKEKLILSSMQGVAFRSTHKEE